VCHQLEELLENVSYFPAYEIMMDDLRDYRFYKEDMIHPSQLAEKYIWEKFGQTYFKPHTIEIIKKWEIISNALQHIPFHPASETYKKFLLETITKTTALSNDIDVADTLQLLHEKLNFA